MDAIDYELHAKLIGSDPTGPEEQPASGFRQQFLRRP
jgi:hypothetical protein